MLNVNTVAQALGPLAKVQKNLEKVSAKRLEAGQIKREQARVLTADSLVDDAEMVAADAILEKLNKLLDPKQGD